jgi:hypothetical protein
MKFNGSSVYVNSFNPALLSADPLPCQRAPECPQLTKLLFAVKEGVLSPEMVNWIMINTHDKANSPHEASAITTTMLKNCPPIDSDADDLPPLLVPYLRTDRFPHSHVSSILPRTCKDTATDNLSPVSVVTNNAEVVDLTNLPDDSSNEPPMKKYKTATIELTIRVKMPGNIHPIVKNSQFSINSNGSSDGSNK